MRYRHIKQRLKMERGFTLLELLVVMVIIGLLAGYVAPKYFSQVGKSEVKAAQAQIDSIEKALDQYRLDTGHYPATEQGLAALMTRPTNELKWQGPYLKKAGAARIRGGDHMSINIRANARNSICTPMVRTASLVVRATQRTSRTGSLRCGTK